MTARHAPEWRILQDPVLFARLGGIALRGYQQEVMRAAADSVLRGRGESYAVMFPRQSGKNETQAQLEAYLLFLLQFRGAELVKISPTWRPQAINALYRLERVLRRNPLTRGLYWKQNGYILGIGAARITFLSGAPGASIVGATATHLLEVDEAQDVNAARYDKDIAPMAASANATRIFWGTAWTSQTLLARETRAASRAFVVTAEAVARETPAYGAFVAGQVARLGRSHPLVRTQFFCEEIDAQASFFPPEAVEKIRGCREQADGAAPETGGAKEYALLVDVAGEERAGAGGSVEDGAVTPEDGAGVPEGEARDRDATALTVVEVARPGMGAPTFRAVERRLWVGERHTRLYEEIRACAERWRARWVVVDATGVGAGLASFLAAALPGRVIPFTFTAASKSRLGWDFLEVVMTGRWQEPTPAGAPEQERLRGLFFRQMAFCRGEALPGPEKRLRWGVPDGARDPATGEPVHDDLLISAALCTRIPAGGWTPAQAGVVRARDPLRDIDRRGF